MVPITTNAALWLRKGLNIFADFVYYFVEVNINPWDDKKKGHLAYCVLTP